MFRKLALAALFATATCALVPTAGAAVSPSGFLMKLHTFAVSAKADCSDPVVVYQAPQAVYVDMAKDPTFGSYAIADGTYPCVMFEMSDVVRFSPAETEGTCVKGETYTLDVCSAHGKEGEAPSFQKLDGSTGTCAAASGTEDRVVLYLSTAAKGGEGGNPFFPPGPDGKGGMPLGAPLVVSGSAVGTLVVDARGRVAPPEYAEDGACDMQPPMFSFE